MDYFIKSDRPTGGPVCSNREGEGLLAGAQPGPELVGIVAAGSDLCSCDIEPVPATYEHAETAAPTSEVTMCPAVVTFPLGTDYYYGSN